MDLGFRFYTTPMFALHRMIVVPAACLRGTRDCMSGFRILFHFTAPGYPPCILPMHSSFYPIIQLTESLAIAMRLLKQKRSNSTALIFKDNQVSTKLRRVCARRRAPLPSTGMMTMAQYIVHGGLQAATPNLYAEDFCRREYEDSPLTIRLQLHPLTPLPGVLSKEFQKYRFLSNAAVAGRHVSPPPSQ